MILRKSNRSDVS
ncbi:hypothetical protein CP061683_1254A, partial [Chlamydia psittaci 06-1683]